MLNKKVLVGVVFVCGLICCSLQGQDYTLNYQGELYEATGESPAPLTGGFEIRFHLFNNDNEVLWGPQTFPEVSVADGAFAVVLGPDDDAGRGLGNVFAKAILSPSPRVFLQIQVGDNQPILPRQEILPVPISYQALRAEFALQSLGTAVGLRHGVDSRAEFFPAGLDLSSGETPFGVTIGFHATREARYRYPELGPSVKRASHFQLGVDDGQRYYSFTIQERGTNGSFRLRTYDSVDSGNDRVLPAVGEGVTSFVAGDRFEYDFQVEFKRVENRPIISCTWTEGPLGHGNGGDETTYTWTGEPGESFPFPLDQPFDVRFLIMSSITEFAVTVND